MRHGAIFPSFAIRRLWREKDRLAQYYGPSKHQSPHAMCRFVTAKEMKRNLDLSLCAVAFCFAANGWGRYWSPAPPSTVSFPPPPIKTFCQGAVRNEILRPRTVRVGRESFPFPHRDISAELMPLQFAVRSLNLPPVSSPDTPASTHNVFFYCSHSSPP